MHVSFPHWLQALIIRHSHPAPPSKILTLIPDISHTTLLLRFFSSQTLITKILYNLFVIVSPIRMHCMLHEGKDLSSLLSNTVSSASSTAHGTQYRRCSASVCWMNEKDRILMHSGPLEPGRAINVQLSNEWGKAELKTALQEKRSPSTNILTVKGEHLQRD